MAKDRMHLPVREEETYCILQHDWIAYRSCDEEYDDSPEENHLVF